jgi:hypothetical protein
MESQWLTPMTTDISSLALLIDRFYTFEWRNWIQSDFDNSWLKIATQWKFHIHLTGYS